MWQNQQGDITGHPKVKFELLSSSGSRAINTNEVITRYHQHIMRVALADFLLLGSTQGSSGSFALGTDRSQMFAHSLRGFNDRIAEALNRQLIRPLWLLNGKPMDACPCLKPGPIARESLTEFGQLIESLASAGMPLFPDEELEAEIRRRAHLPPASEELDVLREMKRDPMAAQEGGDDSPPEGGKDGGKGGAGGKGGMDGGKGGKPSTKAQPGGKNPMKGGGQQSKDKPARTRPMRGGADA